LWLLWRTDSFKIATGLDTLVANLVSARQSLHVAYGQLKYEEALQKPNLCVDNNRNIRVLSAYTILTYGDAGSGPIGPIDSSWVRHSISPCFSSLRYDVFA